MLPLILCLLTQGDEPPANDLTAPRSRPAMTTTAARVTVITGDELRRSGQDNLPRALALKAGLWLQESDWGGGSPVIRGLLGNRILVLVDGVPVNDSTTGLEPNSILNTIDIGTVDRIEVRRGPASVLHGSDAMGGVIEIWTRRRPPGAQDTVDRPRPYEGEVTGNYDTVVRGGYGNLMMSGALEEHSLIAVGSLHDYNDLTRKERDPLPDIAYKGHSAFGAYEYAVDDRKTLRLSARVNRDNDLQRVDQLGQGFNQPLGPIYQHSQFSRRDRKGLVLSYTDNKPGRVFESLQLRAGVRSYKEQRDLRKWDYTDPEAPVPASTRTFEEHTTTSVSLAGDWKKTVSDDHLLTFGFDIDHDDVESTRKEYEDDPEDPDHYVDRSGPFAPGAQYTRSGVFLQDEILAFEPWYVTAGARYAHHEYGYTDLDTGQRVDGSFDALTASVEAKRDLGSGVVGTASVAHAYHLPDLDDLARRGTFTGGDELSNADLDPEQSLTADLGIEVTREEWGGAASVFATRIEDYIGRVLLDAGDPETDGDELFQRANTGRADFLGGEVAAHRRLFDLRGPFTATAALSYVRGVHRDPRTGATPARRVPPAFGRFELLYEPEPPLFRVSFVRLRIHFADNQDRLHPQDVNDPRMDPYGTPGWVVYDIDLGGRINRNSDWWMGFYNLGNEEYRVHGSGFDALGVRVVLGVSIKI